MFGAARASTALRLSVRIPIARSGVVSVPNWNGSHVPRCCVCRRWCALRSVASESFRLQLPWGRIRCVRWLPPRALPLGCATELPFLQLLGRPGTRIRCGRNESWSGPSPVTWLILPVVICLSQRLSHACLSISFYTVKLRMAH